MRHLIIVMLLALGATLSAQHEYNSGWGWGATKVKGNGDVTTQSRDLKGFDGVSTCCNIDVELRQGSFEVRVEAESNLHEYIKTEVNGGRLEVSFKSRVSIKAREKITVYVTLPELKYLGASSSGELVCKSTFKGGELEADVSSGGYISLDFMGAELEVSASSGGKLEASGGSDRMKVDASSGGSVRAADFTAKNCRANASSGGGVTVNVVDELQADASSGGSVRYGGNPDKVASETSSGGSVRSKN